MFIPCPGSQTTILFSHGNATDIGCMRDHLLELAVMVNANILAYDYCGFALHFLFSLVDSCDCSYGLSSGKPNMANSLSDVEAAYQALITRYPNASKNVILCAQLSIQRAHTLTGCLMQLRTESGKRAKLPPRAQI